MSQPRPVPETLFLALNNHWNLYQVLLKKCRKDPKRNGVHDLRTTHRRLIATLDLIRNLIDLDETDRLRRQLKRQLHSLRDLRDFQVQEKLLKEDRESSPLNPVRKFLRKKRKTEEKTAIRCLRRVALGKQGTQVLRIDEELKHLGTDPKKEEPFTEFLKRIVVQSFESLESCAEHAKASDPASLHKARIQFKKYRYAREVLAPSFPVSFSVKDKMKTLQALLGDIQDSVVMIRTVLSFLVEEGLTDPDPAVQNFLIAAEEKQKALIAQFQSRKGKLLSGIQPQFSLAARKAA